MADVDVDTQKGHFLRSVPFQGVATFVKALLESALPAYRLNVVAMDYF